MSTPCTNTLTCVTISSLLAASLIGLGGCRKAAQSAVTLDSSKAYELGLPEDTQVELKHWRQVEDFDRDLAQFETVFWESSDTDSLRALIRDSDLVKDKSVLEIGCGTGLVSLCCLQAGARRVVATDINPSAIANAAYNAEHLGLGDRLELRLVTSDNPSAFAVIDREERFDLIISNPPWEDGTPKSFEDHALYDPQFALLRSLITEFDLHLEPQGRVLLAYGCVDAIRKAEVIADEALLSFEILDDRQLDDLPNVFLPGMLLEIRR